MDKNKRIITAVILFISILGIAAYSQRENIRNSITKLYFQNAQNKDVNNSTQRTMEESEEPVIETEVLAENLEIPWEILFLNENKILITERPGNVLILDQEIEEITQIEGVEHIGEGGLLGAVASPNFEENNYIYLYYTTSVEEQLQNKVVRYTLEDNTLMENKIILEGVPGASYHDGGRMEFGPDGYLYITTGDAGNIDSAQDTDSLSGKILRLNSDGSVPEDNPFGNSVYSYGHRNPQGLTWDEEGRLWSTEHGPSGLQSGFDELNLITKGNNYGWPEVKGEETGENFTSPVIQSGSDETWAPAGAAYYEGNIYFAGLRGSTLYKYNIESKQLSRHLVNKYGRLRAVVLGPDNYLYISTSNKDGRGNSESTDDRIIRVNPQIL